MIHLTWWQLALLLWATATVGGVFGFLTLALCAAAKRGDEHMERDW